MTRLPQPYALRIEMIRAKGFSEQEVLALLERGDAAELAAKVNAELSWDPFIAYVREHWETFQAAVLNGYRFSFMTIGGMKSLLEIRFNKTEKQDYRSHKRGIEGLKLSLSELQTFRKFVPSAQWAIEEKATDAAGQAVEVRIELNSTNCI